MNRTFSATPSLAHKSNHMTFFFLPLRPLLVVTVRWDGKEPEDEMRLDPRVASRRRAGLDDLHPTFREQGTSHCCTRPLGLGGLFCSFGTDEAILTPTLIRSPVSAR